VDVVEELLRHPQIDVNHRSQNKSTPYLLAALNGRVEVVKLLLHDPRVDLNLPDKLDRTPLWEAASYGHTMVINWMFASGRKLEVDRIGKATAETKEMSVLDVAKERARVEVVALLESFKANRLSCRLNIRRELGIQGKRTRTRIRN